jgi:hypothetical protein
MLSGAPFKALESDRHFTKKGRVGSISTPRRVCVVKMDDSCVASEVWSETVTRKNPLNSKELSSVQYKLESSMGTTIAHSHSSSPVADDTRAETTCSLLKKLRPFHNNAV